MRERIAGVSPAYPLPVGLEVLQGGSHAAQWQARSCFLPVGTTLPRNPPKQDAGVQSAGTSVREARLVKRVEATPTHMTTDDSKCLEFLRTVSTPADGWSSRERSSTSTRLWSLGRWIRARSLRSSSEITCTRKVIALSFAYRSQERISQSRVVTLSIPNRGMSFLVACGGWPASERGPASGQVVEHRTLPKTTPVRTGLRPPGGPCPGAYNGRAATAPGTIVYPAPGPLRGLLVDT